MSARPDPMLFEGCLRYFRGVANNPELARYEPECPGCSTTAPPWSGSDAAKITYRTVTHNTGVGGRSPARRYILTATIGGGTFAHYMPTLGIWEVIIRYPRRRP